MVHIVGCIAVAVKSEITCPDALGIDQSAFIGFYVFFVLADAEANGVVMVIVIDRRHALDEVLISGGLDDDIPIDAGLAVVMPDQDGVQIEFTLEVDLD